jgi:hypothetical protein
VDRHFDLQKSLWLVCSEFDLEQHAAKMKTLNPHWSDRQCRCVLYWQSRSRKQLKKRATDAVFFLGIERNFSITYCPEGMGVNVYATARLSGLSLEPIRRLGTCRHVALLGFSGGRS